MKLFKYTMLIGAVCAAFTLQPAKADIITGTSILGDANVSGFPGPFGTVTLSLDVTTQVATFTFNSNTAGGYFFIDGSASGVNVSTTFDNFTLITDPDFKQTSSGNVDGFGTFNLLIDNNHASTLVSTISFSIHNTGTAWAGVNDVLAFNSKGADAVAHVNFGNGVTGFVAEKGPFTTPDSGTTAMLLGLGLAGVAGIRARFGRK